MREVSLHVNRITACKFSQPLMAQTTCIPRSFIFPRRILESRISSRKLTDQNVELRWWCRCLIAFSAGESRLGESWISKSHHHRLTQETWHMTGVKASMLTQSMELNRNLRLE